MNFNQFLFKYHEGTLDTDAAWRAYDFMASVRDRHVRKALKQLGLTYAGELAVPQFMALYDLEDRTQATLLVGAWWLWTQVDRGARVMGLVRRPGRASEGRELGV